MYKIEWTEDFAKAYYAAVIESEAIIKAILEENKKLPLSHKEWIRGICLIKWLGIKEINTKTIFINAKKRPAYITKKQLEKYVEQIKKIGPVEYLKNILKKIGPVHSIWVRFAAYPRGYKAKWVYVVD
jgi:hypothetical protein